MCAQVHMCMPSCEPKDASAFFLSLFILIPLRRALAECGLAHQPARPSDRPTSTLYCSEVTGACFNSWVLEVLGSKLAPHSSVASAVIH